MFIFLYIGYLLLLTYFIFIAMVFVSPSITCYICKKKKLSGLGFHQYYIYYFLSTRAGMYLRVNPYLGLDSLLSEMERYLSHLCGHL